MIWSTIISKHKQQTIRLDSSCRSSGEELEIGALMKHANLFPSRLVLGIVLEHTIGIWMRCFSVWMGTFRSEKVLIYCMSLVMEGRRRRSICRRKRGNEGRHGAHHRFLVGDGMIDIDLNGFWCWFQTVNSHTVGKIG